MEKICEPVENFSQEMDIVLKVEKLKCYKNKNMLPEMKNSLIDLLVQKMQLRKNW